jgi:RNA polymerase sigma-70 factor (ECF subfamily)
LATCYRPALLLHLSRRVEDPHRAEDLVQDTLLRAWQTRGTYVAGKESSWIKWCKRIADRLLIDLWRRERLLDILLLADVCADASCRDAQDVVEWHVRAKSPSPEEQVLVAEQLDAAQRAIRRLPLPQQTALTLRTEGYGLDEIAAILCLPRGTVKVYIYRARSALRGMFARMTALRSE